MNNINNYVPRQQRRTTVLGLTFAYQLRPATVN